MSALQLPASAENVQKIIPLLQSLLLQPTVIKGKTYFFKDGILCVVLATDSEEIRAIQLPGYALAQLVKDCVDAAEMERFLAGGAELINKIINNEGEINV